MDLDVPENELHFSILQAPRHGSIVHYGVDGLNSTRVGPPGAGPVEPALDFTLRDLQNGTSVHLKDSWL